jgi:hypothetical protein
MVLARCHPAPLLLRKEFRQVIATIIDYPIEPPPGQPWHEEKIIHWRVYTLSPNCSIAKRDGVVVHIDTDANHLIHLIETGVLEVA